MLGDKAAIPPGKLVDQAVRDLVLMIANRGRYTITSIEGQFSPDGKSPISHDTDVRLPGLDNLPDRLRAGQPGRIEPAYGNSLTPWDVGMRFEANGIPQKDISAPYAIVRWTDLWGQRWEHKKGEVRKIGETEHWVP